MDIWTLLTLVVGGSTVFVAVLAGWAVWHFRIRHKREALIVRKSQGRAYTIIKKFDFDLGDSKIYWKGNPKKKRPDKNFRIDLNAVALLGSRLTQLIFDFDTGDLLYFGGSVREGNPDDIDIVNGCDAVDSIIQRLKAKPKVELLMLILGIVAGCAVGVVVGIYLYPRLFPQIVEAVVDSGAVPVV